MKNHPPRPPMPRGFALVIVLVFLAVISIACASMIASVTFEKRMTRRTIAIAELKTATDTLLNYAAAQATGNTGLIPNGIKVPPAGLFKGGSDPAQPGATGPFSLVRLADQEIYVSPLKRYLNTDTKQGVPPRFYIDPNAPINLHDDEVKGKQVFRDLCLIASKAAVKDPLNPVSNINEYAVLVLERRSYSVFDYLAFFDVAKFRVTNPGSNIILDGPIQSNQGIFFEAHGQSSTVYMDSTVSTPGTLVFGTTTSSPASTSAGKFMITDGTFKTDGITPNRFDLLKPGTGVLRQTSDDINAGPDDVYFTADDRQLGTSFKDFSNNTTKGFLKTGETGGQTVELDGLNYVDDSAAAIPDTYKVSLNRRIDPPNPALRNDTSGKYPDAQTAEAAKTAYQARLYTYVETDGTVTVFTNQADAESYKTAGGSASSWKDSNKSRFLDAGEAGGFIKTPYAERYYNSASPTSTTAYTDLSRNAIFDSQQKSTVAMVDVDLGELNNKLTTAGALKLADGSYWNAKGTTGWNGVFYVDVQNPATRIAAPVVDKKTGAYINPTTKLPDPAITSPAKALVAKLPSLNITGTAQAWDTGGAVNDTQGLTGVRIKNAKTVPSALIGDPGFTLATNTATYTVGSLNADGDTTTGTTSLQDGQTKASDDLLAADKVTKAVPVAIFSDKNIVLSDDFNNPGFDLNLYVPKPASKPSGMSQTLYDNWPFSTAGVPASGGYTLGGKGNGQYNYRIGTGTKVMELNAGFIIGDDDNSNKGIHTVLSYLQAFNPTSDTLRMRGSIIGIYKSRYFKAPAGSFGDYYVAPQRTFGYSSLFKSGLMPPAAPTISGYRRMRQFNIGKADYEAIKAGPNTVDAWLDNVISAKY